MSNELPKWEDHGQKILESIPEAKCVFVGARGMAFWSNETIPEYWHCSKEPYYLGRFQCDDWKKSLIVKKWKPKEGEQYYMADINSEKLFSMLIWDEHENDHLWYERGLVFKTKEEAIAKANRLLEVE